MRKTVLYVAAWFLAGVAAVALASAGVSMVSQQVTGSRPAPLSAQQVREELAATNAEDPDGRTTTTTTITPTSTTEAGDPGTGRAPTTAPPGSPSGPGSPGGGTPTTTAVPAPPIAPATTRSYDLVGGTTTLRFGPAGVEVVVATPKAGFSVDVSDSHGSGARVEFESDDHRSRVDAWWDGGPQDEVREDD